MALQIARDMKCQGMETTYELKRRQDGSKQLLVYYTGSNYADAIRQARSKSFRRKHS